MLDKLRSQFSGKTNLNGALGAMPSSDSLVFTHYFLFLFCFASSGFFLFLVSFARDGGFESSSWAVVRERAFAEPYKVAQFATRLSFSLLFFLSLPFSSLFRTFAAFEPVEKGRGK